MGGVQLVCSGDFCQLPPVAPAPPLASLPLSLNARSLSQPSIAEYFKRDISSTSSGPDYKYCFQSSQWSQVFPIQNCHLLSTIFRQQHDPEYASILEELRYGKLSEESRRTLDACVGKRLAEEHGVLPMLLVTHRKECDEQNKEQVEALDGEPVDFKAKDSGDTAFLAALQRHCPAKTVLRLKAGAQVMLIKTIDPSRGLVNGARGIIVKFTS